MSAGHEMDVLQCYQKWAQTYVVELRVSKSFERRVAPPPRGVNNGHFQSTDGPRSAY